jgi:hypothetical protein
MWRVLTGLEQLRDTPTNTCMSNKQVQMWSLSHWKNEGTAIPLLKHVSFTSSQPITPQSPPPDFQMSWKMCRQVRQGVHLVRSATDNKRDTYEIQTRRCAHLVPMGSLVGQVPGTGLAAVHKPEVAQRQEHNTGCAALLVQVEGGYTLAHTVVAALFGQSRQDTAGPEAPAAAEFAMGRSPGNSFEVVAVAQAAWPNRRLTATPTPLLIYCSGSWHTLSSHYWSGPTASVLARTSINRQSTSAVGSQRISMGKDLRPFHHPFSQNWTCSCPEVKMVVGDIHTTWD